MGGRTIGGAKRDEILVQACQRETGAEVRREGVEEGSVLRSRMLRAMEGGTNPHVVMDLPTEEGRAASIHEGEELEVTFQGGGERVGFRAEVKGRCFERVRAAEETGGRGTWVPAILVTYPEELEVRQRRAYYRVPLSRLEQCRVVFGETEMYTGLAEDLSTGGIGIRSRDVGTRERAVSGLGVGTRVRLWFQLPGGSQDVALVGEIRNRRADEEEGTMLGVEFVETEQSLEGRRGIGVIGKYVAARQRELLRKTKGND